MAGASTLAAPAGTDQLDLEAAEQLIQLSGGDGADDDAGSETRSADSIKCRGKGKEKEKEAAPAVESRRRSAGRASLAPGNGKDGGGGESGSKGADSSASARTTRAAGTVGQEDDKAAVDESGRRSGERFPAEKDDCDGGIVHGEARRRPRFRSLADIYRETETRRMAGGGGEAHAGRDHPPHGQRKKGKKRAAGEAIPGDDAEASKERRLAQSSAHARK